MLFRLKNLIQSLVNNRVKYMSGNPKQNQEMISYLKMRYKLEFNNKKLLNNNNNY